MKRSSKRIAIIGAGPIGLEAALYGSRLGYDVSIYERGRIAEHLRSWGHVRLFSPFRLNRSPLGLTELCDAGLDPPSDSGYLTGDEHARRYLIPLADSRRLRGRVHQATAVVAASRDGLGKSQRLAGGRESAPFRLLLDGPEGERIAEADVLIDCSGTYGRHNWIGNGGIPALGERALAGRITYSLEGLNGAARERYRGRRILLVGDGLSAATALDGLRALDDISVLWLSRKERAEPIAAIEDDPLPERARLTELANRLARGSDPRIEFRNATQVDAIEAQGERFHLRLRRGGAQESVSADRVLALVGYSPDNSLYSELQVHECYATRGPMRLAASLLSAGSTDCLAQQSHGADALRNPEPDFYILGAKSYGSNSSFLIKLGIEQVREAYTLIEGRPELDLYAG